MSNTTSNLFQDYRNKHSESRTLNAFKILYKSKLIVIEIVKMWFRHSCLQYNVIYSVINLNRNFSQLLFLYTLIYKKKKSNKN